jgi:enediyne biosynthesis protein E4
MKGKLINGCVAVVMLSVVMACDNELKLFKKLESRDSGIQFENKLVATEDFNIIDYMYFYNGGGVAVGDINGDQLADIYFSGNQVGNKLYLNKGNLKFEDITEKAGVAGTSTWKTGSVMGDVNGDGLLDIYVCAVVGIRNLRGHNELFINNGDNTFSEKSAEYGLDFESYSSSAAFLDYDLDGDLDMYLLNHAVHTSGSFGHADLRKKRVYESGGKLLRNDTNKFIDVSEQAGIYGGVNGYGLGVAISDFNQDGYPDIYVGNDFHEDDYFYINNGDGTFTEKGKKAFTCTSKFSMGNDVGDINHDGLPDIMTLDMLPEDEELIKRSVDEENISIQRMRTEKYGYNYQYPRNMLQVNLGNGKFAEAALLGNVAATDWSWSALFSDFDQDGHQDLFISNGIPKRPNDLDYIKFVSSEQIVNVIGTTNIVDQKALAMMPEGNVRNYIFKGSGSYEFYDKSNNWLPDEKTCSTATAYGDLDNDGDLDLVINNVNEEHGIYINNVNSSANYLKIKLKYNTRNPFGIGARIYSYHQGQLQFKEMYTARGFQASSEPIIHFGYGDNSSVDSIKVIWPNGNVDKIFNVKTNQTITVTQQSSVNSKAVAANATDPINTEQNHSNRISSESIFQSVNANDIGLTYEHHEDPYTDFDRLKLLPYQQSDRGPATAVGDLNNDGLMDLYFGGSKHIPGQIYLQSTNGFVKATIPSIVRDSIKEDVDAVIHDFNNDGAADLFIATGGADFYQQSRPLLDSYYTSSDSTFSLTEISGYYENASCLKEFDFDADGDLDLFVGNESVSNDFGAMPKSYLLKNEKGRFGSFQPEVFEKLGMVTDAVWSDYNHDGKTDIVVVGEWMSPVFLKNNGQGFEREDMMEADELNGLWQSISTFDIDNDGDKDYILGNWGLNSRFRASFDEPMLMYYNDFDQNGTSETIVALEKNGRYFPLDGFDVIASQIVGLRKKYTSYQAFAGKTVEEVFSDQQLEHAIIYKVHCLASGYLKNENGKFKFQSFPSHLQVAPIMAQLSNDFDGDGREELLLAGNYFGVQPFHGRYGSFDGAVIKSETEIISGVNAGLNLINQSVRNLKVISVNGNRYLLISINDGKLQVYKFHSKI